MGTRKRRREFEEREQVVCRTLVGSFTEWLSTDPLPRPGFVRTDDQGNWCYLDGETVATMNGGSRT